MFLIPYIVFNTYLQYLTAQIVDELNSVNSIPIQERVNVAKMLQNFKDKSAQTQTYHFKKQKKPNRQQVGYYPYQGSASLGAAMVKKQHEYYLSLPEMYIEAMQLLQQKVHPTYSPQAVVDDVHYQQQMYKKESDRKSGKHNSFELKCSSNHVINYIWIGGGFAYYKNLVDKCGDKARMLQEKHINQYIKQWNDRFDTKISARRLGLVTKVDLGKLLFLYFESGIYADLDSEIDETCFNNIQSDKMIYGNSNYRSFANNVVPQQNFIYVQDKYNKQVERQIFRMISGNNEWRWDQCQIDQCQILMCGRHLRANTFAGGN